ncbi:unnamed protein product [Euphydryas editha]|uniref:Peptidase S1 domain-containing protein n=1 Tax=Euphydryas editha TaxID=104508 RepID=A0AAU9TSB4_EUPED|nr:unnamed protein product [Euphydryas editha]
MCFKYLILFAYLIICDAIPSQLDDHFYHVDTSKRIVGGSVASEGSLPYIAALRTGFLIRWLICGGSIITNRHVLTAAHCLDAVRRDRTFRLLRVVVGTNQWNYGGQTYSVAKMITHERWNPSTVKNDIGFLITTTRMRLTDRVQLIALNFDYIGGNITSKVAGWGRTETGGTLSSLLLELIVHTVDGENCSRAIDEHCDPSEQNIKYDSEVELCAFNSDLGGVCNGDSGSALVRLDSSEQIGVVSWGYACARGAPDMYVRLSAYKEWIRDVLLLNK